MRPAIENLHTLSWTYYSLIHDAIDRAKKFRESVSMFLPSKNLLAEIEEVVARTVRENAHGGNPPGTTGPVGGGRSSPVGSRPIGCWPR